VVVYLKSFVYTVNRLFMHYNVATVAHNNKIHMHLLVS